MPIITTDQIGDFGEWLAAADLSRPVKSRYKRPLFKPTHLGGKYPVVDLIVDALAADATSLGFFFIQIKSTASAGNATGRLPIQVSAERFNQMVRIPAPTYLVGVDVTSEQCFLVAAHKPRASPISGMTTAYNLKEDGVKTRLYKEVIEFWKINKPLLQNTEFKDG